jgi:hypothetical protein
MQEICTSQTFAHAVGNTGTPATANFRNSKNCFELCVRNFFVVYRGTQLKLDFERSLKFREPIASIG